VLKDASAASIYGSRASNGVILIETTKKGLVGPPRSTFRVRTGWANPTRGYDDFLIQNSLDYFKVVKAAFQNAGQPIPTNIYGDSLNPSVPKYIWPNNCGTSGKDACNSVDLSKYSYPNNLIMPGSNGTDWWKAVFGTGKVTDANMNVSGGGPDNTYGVSFSLFDQSGTARYNEFKRGTVRANTEFRRSKLNFGENLAIGVERAYGGQGDDNFGEGGILGKNILMQPIVPIYDIAGNFASGKANTLGNNTNPLKLAYTQRDNLSKNNRVFGNVFGGLAVLPTLSLRSSFGFNVFQGSFSGYTAPTPENSEATLGNSIYENQAQGNDWTWSNTATYAVTYGQSTLNLLGGGEANHSTYRRMDGSLANILNPAVDSRFIQDALGDASTKNITSSGDQSALLSVFGKADYNFADRYIVSATVRRDGSSRLGPANRWGTFPAFGLGWHISNESFLQNNPYITDANIRYGWGVTGNQQITPGRIVSQYGGNTGATFYDIRGSNTNLVAGYRQISLGNPNLKWEEDRSQNIGTDLTLFNSNVNVVLDVYKRITDNLLFDPRLPATAGEAAPPIVNIGSMRNTGFDLSIGHRGSWWDATFNGSHYKNTILSIDGVSNSFFGPASLRFSNTPVINELGHPVGSFYGFVAQGFFRDSADIAAHAQQDGAKPGRIKFKDVNGDGKITDADQTIIGSPHPKFTAGLDLNFRWHSFDLSGTLFGSYGNKILDAQKQFYVFRNFSTNVRKDLLANSWTPTHMNAKYPRIDVSDTYSSRVSSFYVEDGSYTRLRSMQLGYTIPAGTPYLGRALTGTRVYFQGDNLFTITGYDGLDPALPAHSATGPAGDIRDQYRGIDQGTYPSNRVFSIGLSTTF
jgi:TonB-linked SusC/RagA family outer membrane protein